MDEKLGLRQQTHAHTRTDVQHDVGTASNLKKRVSARRFRSEGLSPMSNLKIFNVVCGL